MDGIRMRDEEVEKWKKRLKKKGPFYLYKTEPFDKKIMTFIDNVGHPGVVPCTRYYVIWNDGLYKTKYGTLEDRMACRYGIGTITVLNGDTKFDLWNGQCIDDEIFDEMIKVREETSELPHFDLDTLKDIDR